MGIIPILIEQVVEEKIMTRYKTEPLAAVTLEGFFGLTTTLIAMPFLHYFFSDRSPYFDMPLGWSQIVHSPAVLWLCFAICLSIGAFNYFGLSVTSRVSATTRSTIDTCRTLGIWIVSLGVGWEKLVFPISLLQVAGFAMLVYVPFLLSRRATSLQMIRYGTFVFNGLVAPLCCPPPASVHLPHEPELEETGELPAAAAHTRAGYDVVPEGERRGN